MAKKILHMGFLWLFFMGFIARAEEPCLECRNYCENYIAAFAKNLYPENSEFSIEVKAIEEKSGFLKFLSNFFQPKDSRIEAIYSCYFTLEKKEGIVDILLIQNKDYALYAQWESIQFIPVSNENKIKLGSKSYYPVVKYLKYDNKNMHLRNP